MEWSATTAGETLAIFEIVVRPSLFTLSAWLPVETGASPFINHVVNLFRRRNKPHPLDRDPAADSPLPPNEWTS
jgi:hypothetical protein